MSHEIGQPLSEVIIMFKEKPTSSRKNANTGDPVVPGPPEKPIARVYPVIDNDLARDNVENDIPAADLEDL